MALKNYVEQKVVLITGGASGFGFCLAKKCIELGAKIILTDIDQDAISKALVQLSASEDAVIGLLARIANTSMANLNYTGS